MSSIVLLSEVYNWPIIKLWPLVVPLFYYSKANGKHGIVCRNTQ